jgi:hypothetical protein
MIQKSIQRLAKSSGASQLRFFGKIYGYEQDYWVARGVVNQIEDCPKNEKQEKRGRGVNSTVFWVSTDLLKDWVQLPEAQPEHILAAQQIKQ